MTMLMASNRAESEEYNGTKFVRIALVESEEIMIEVGKFSIDVKSVIIPFRSMLRALQFYDWSAKSVTIP